MKITSSTISEVEHGPDGLTVYFLNGRSHRYPGVTKDEYEALVSAPSPGSYFHLHIRHRKNERVR